MWYLLTVFLRISSNVCINNFGIHIIYAAFIELYFILLLLYTGSYFEECGPSFSSLAMCDNFEDMKLKVAVSRV